MVWGAGMSETPTTLTVADWPGLEDWLEAHPLPDGVEDLDMNMAELSTVVNVSTNAINGWLKQRDNPLPCVARGGNGREYVLRYSWFHAWKARGEALKKSKDQALAKLQGQLFGVEPEQSANGLSPKQVSEVSEARMKHAQAAKMMGILTELEACYRLFDKVFIRFRDSAMGMSDRLERELGLSAPQARQVDRAMEEMLTSLIEEIGENDIGKGYEANLDMHPQLVNET